MTPPDGPAPHVVGASCGPRRSVVVDHRTVQRMTSQPRHQHNEARAGVTRLSGLVTSPAAVAGFATHLVEERFDREVPL
jgi:hypothetical protein